jgi:hypothetical protein
MVSPLSESESKSEEVIFFMRYGSYQQYAIVIGTSAQDLTEQLNAKLRELSKKRPQVEFEGLIARISYTETVAIPETLADEYELQGVKFCCEVCPMFEPITKADGTIDKRIRYGNCPYRELGRTFKTSPMCEELYRMINDGRVKLCFAELLEQ